MIKVFIGYAAAANSDNLLVAAVEAQNEAAVQTAEKAIGQGTDFVAKATEAAEAKVIGTSGL